MIEDRSPWKTEERTSGTLISKTVNFSTASREM